MTDLRPSLDPAFSVFGVDVTIPLAPGLGQMLTVRAIPLPYRLADPALGSDLRDQAPRMVLGFRRADIEWLPRGTLIEAPEIQGGAVQTWKVESAEYLGADEIRVLVVRA